MCHVAALKDMISNISAGSRYPLFVLKSGRPVKLNTHLEKICEILSKCGVNPN